MPSGLPVWAGAIDKMSLKETIEINRRPIRIN